MNSHVGCSTSQCGEAWEGPPFPCVLSPRKGSDSDELQSLSFRNGLLLLYHNRTLLYLNTQELKRIRPQPHTVTVSVGLRSSQLLG